MKVFKQTKISPKGFRLTNKNVKRNVILAGELNDQNQISIGWSMLNPVDKQVVDQKKGEMIALRRARVNSGKQPLLKLELSGSVKLSNAEKFIMLENIMETFVKTVTANPELVMQKVAR